MACCCLDERSRPCVPRRPTRPGQRSAFRHATRAEEKCFPRDSACLHVAFLPVPTPAACTSSARSPVVLSLPQRPAQQRQPSPPPPRGAASKATALGTVTLTGAHEHSALPTSSRTNIFSASSLSVVRYCLYSFNSFRVQTTYGETSPENRQASCADGVPSPKQPKPSGRGAAPLHTHPAPDGPHQHHQG